MLGVRLRTFWLSVLFATHFVCFENFIQLNMITRSKQSVASFSELCTYYSFSSKSLTLKIYCEIISYVTPCLRLSSSTVFLSVSVRAVWPDFVPSQDGFDVVSVQCFVLEQCFGERFVLFSVSLEDCFCTVVAIAEYLFDLVVDLKQKSDLEAVRNAYQI